MTVQPGAAGDSTTALAVAAAFVEARATARALRAFPGALPRSLPEAYACQEAAIRLWPDEIAGWKVGRAPVAAGGTEAERLAGPIFRRAVRSADHSLVRFPVFVAGFAAVEAEFVFEIAADAPPEKLRWTDAEARAAVAALRVGVELAGSPLAAINALGPEAVVADFGNNNGLIVGPPLPHWREIDPAELEVEARVEGRLVGRGSAGDLLGGPIEALRWLLEHCAARGRPLRRRQLVSTGAATGIHEIAAGQRAEIRFGIHGTIRCEAESA